MVALFELAYKAFWTVELVHRFSQKLAMCNFFFSKKILLEKCSDLLNILNMNVSLNSLAFQRKTLHLFFNLSFRYWLLFRFSQMRYLNDAFVIHWGVDCTSTISRNTHICIFRRLRSS